MENIIMDKLAWIGGAIIGSIITIICKEIYEYYKNKVSKKVLHNFWNFQNKNVLIIHPAYYGPKGGQMPPNMARIEDVLAMQYIVNSLNEINIKCNIQDDHQDIPTETDLILICSPKGNNISLKFRETCQMPYEFCIDPKNPEVPFIKDSASGGIRRSPVDEDNKNKYDLAMLGRCTDKKYSRRVFLFWGIHGVGTLAAAKYIGEKNNLKKLIKEINGKDFNMLIEAFFLSARDIGEIVADRPKIF